MSHARSDIGRDGKGGGEATLKLEGFREFDNILGQVDPRIARKWHKPVQNAILWEKMQKWKIMVDFRLFAVKSMKFSLTRFSKISKISYMHGISCKL